MKNLYTNRLAPLAEGRALDGVCKVQNIVSYDLIFFLVLSLATKPLTAIVAPPRGPFRSMTLLAIRAYHGRWKFRAAFPQNGKTIELYNFFTIFTRIASSNFYI